MEKRILYLCIVFIILVGKRGAYAEPPTDPGILDRLGFGIQGGPSVTWFSGEDASSDIYTSTRRVGFGVRAFTRGALGSWLALRPELAFASKGTAYRLIPIMETGEIRSSYLSVSLLTQMTALRYGHVESFFLIGLDVGFLVACEDEALEEIEDCKQTSKFMDLGLPIGAGIAADLPWPGQVLLEIRYEHGLISVDDTDFQADYRNRSVLFSIGYAHHLGAPVN